MEGPTYQPASPWSSQASRCSIFIWVTIFVPGGANGVAEKLNSPKMYM